MDATATDYHRAYDRIPDDGRCPDCGGEDIRRDIEAPRARCRDCGLAKVGPVLWDFLPDAA